MRTVSQEGINFNHILTSLQSIQALKDYERKIYYFDEYYTDPVRLLIIGEFNAGKSTLINALLGRDVAAIGKVATTAVPTFFRYSTEEYAEIVYTDGTKRRRSFDEIMKINSERQASTKQERLQLQKINVYLKHPILQNIVLVDSPGLNSSNSEHTEHTLNVIHEVDDAMWIFQYGHVGRNSEYEQLNDLRKAGIHPVGVVNMIDNADEDDLTPYLDYEMKKLQGRIRTIIGVSALEAKEALEMNDSELLQISGFPQFIQTLTTIKKQTANKMTRFKKQLSEFWPQFSQDVQKVLVGEFYESKVSQLQSFQKSFKLEFDEKLQEIEHAIKAEKETYAQLLQFATIEDGQDFIEWFQSPFTKLILEDRLYNEIDAYVSKIASYQQAVREMDQHIMAFNTLVKAETPAIFAILPRLIYGAGDFVNLRQQREQLLQQRKALKKQYKDIKKQVKSLKELVNKRFEQLNVGLNTGAAQLQKNIQQRIDERVQLVKLIADDKRLVENVQFDLQPIESLIDQMKVIEIELIPTMAKSYFLRHQDVIEDTYNVLDSLQKKVETDEVFTIESLQLQREFEIKPIDKPKEKLDFMILRNYRPFTVIAAIVVVMGIIVGNHYLTIKDDLLLKVADGKEQLEQLVAKDEKEEEPEPKQVQKKELSFLTPSEYYDGAMGTVTITRDNFIYSSNDFEGEPIYKAAKDTVWPVFEQYENWYKIENDYWVHSSYSEYEDLYTVENSVGNLSNALSTVTISNNYTPVYMNDEFIFDLPMGTYDVYAFDGTNALQIGEQTWIAYSEEFKLQQPMLAQQLDEEIVGYVTTNIAPIAIYDSADTVVGLLTEKVRLPIYDRQYQIVRIGQDMWVSMYEDVDVELRHSLNTNGLLLYIEGEALPTYSEPDEASARTGALASNSFHKTIEVLGGSNWYKVDHNKWVKSSASIKSIVLTGYQIGYAKVLVKNLNARLAPSLDAEVYKQYQPNDEIRVFGISDDLQWLQVGGGLWINANPDYIKFEPI